MERIIILLGNPGPRYAQTRHNLGWWVGDVLAEEARQGFRAGWGRFYYSEIEIDDDRVLLVKPTTYMNLSGQAVVELAERLTVTPDQLIVIADDLAIPLGQLRIRPYGSSGGHNGLASIIEALGSDQFVRVRCGVGPVPAGVDAAEFVLAPFAPNELSSARDMAEQAAAAVIMIVTDGVVQAANTFNRKPPAPDAPSGDQSGADRPREGQ
jgi:peptidyl-tRNA hydrolase, PTH1 family